ncbi:MULTISPECIES: hypothetical protein [Staphylococcus]|nr:MULTISPECIES: hypothetical protein [Staphylococcus]
MIDILNKLYLPSLNKESIVEYP